MPNPALSPEKVEMLRVCLLVGRDANGRRWTDERLARGLGITDRTVRKYRRNFREGSAAIVRARDLIEARRAEARELIGIDE